jgi:hypothetical protein
MDTTNTTAETPAVEPVVAECELQAPVESERRGNARRESGDPRDRRESVDRRCGLDRRRGPGRRRSDDRRSAEEGEMTEDQFEFVMAIHEYKNVNRRPFPTWTEILDVMKALGYRKVAKRQDIQ